MPIPLPGQPVRGSRSGAPIMALFDLLGRSWALGVLWILNREGPCTFRRLQDLCGAPSPTVLNTRLKDLRVAGLIARGEGGYQVTPMGRELCETLRPLKAWSVEWARALEGQGGES